MKLRKEGTMRKVFIFGGRTKTKLRCLGRESGTRRDIHFRQRNDNCGLNQAITNQSIISRLSRTPVRTPAFAMHQLGSRFLQCVSHFLWARTEITWEGDIQWDQFSYCGIPTISWWRWVPMIRACLTSLYLWKFVAAHFMFLYFRLLIRQCVLDIVQYRIRYKEWSQSW